MRLVLAILIVLAAWASLTGRRDAQAQDGRGVGVPSLPGANGQHGQPPATVIRVGWCSKAFTVAAAPYAVAIQKGWLAREGVTLDLTPTGGSGECVKQVVSETLAFAQPSVEQTAVMRAQGAKLRYFYTAYQSNIYGMAVPVDSPIKSTSDLKDARIGVVSTTAAGAVIARWLAREARLDPERDIALLVAGDPQQTADLLKSGAIQALSQFDTHYALVERAGVRLRRLAHAGLDQFPANGLIALEDTLKAQRREAVVIARAYAMGTIYATANPEAAIRALWSVWPVTRPAEARGGSALQDAVAMLLARVPAWQLDRAGAKLWGEHIDKNYQAYLDWLYANSFLNEKVQGRDLVTSDLLKEINAFDAGAVLTEALKDKP